jgi:hypothetical protein
LFVFLFKFLLIMHKIVLIYRVPIIFQHIYIVQCANQSKDTYLLKYYFLVMKTFNTFSSSFFEIHSISFFYSQNYATTKRKQRKHFTIPLFLFLSHTHTTGDPNQSNKHTRQAISLALHLLILLALLYTDLKI